MKLSYRKGFLILYFGAAFALVGGDLFRLVSDAGDPNATVRILSLSEWGYGAEYKDCGEVSKRGFYAVERFYPEPAPFVRQENDNEAPVMYAPYRESEPADVTTLEYRPSKMFTVHIAPELRILKALVYQDFKSDEKP